MSQRWVRSGHRSVGVFLSIFIFLLATTGLLLNHNDELGLASTKAPDYFSVFYFNKDVVVSGYEFDGDYFYLLGGELYANQKQLGFCGVDLTGVIGHQDNILFLCDGNLLIVNNQWEIVERLTVIHGLPSKLIGMGKIGDASVLASANQYYEIDLINLEFGSVKGVYSAIQLIRIPAESIVRVSITMDKLILDIHSGRLFGRVGKVGTDLIALLLLLLSFSGLILFMQRTKKK